MPISNYNMGKAFRLFGFFFFIMGAFIIFNSFSGITGFAVYEDVDVNYGFIIGAWFVLTGLLLAIYRKRVNKEVKKSGKRKR